MFGRGAAEDDLVKIPPVVAVATEAPINSRRVSFDLFIPVCLSPGAKALLVDSGARRVLNLRVLTFRLRHCFGFQFFRAFVHPDKESPRGEQGSCSDTDGGRLRELGSIVMDQNKYGDEGFDRQCDYDHHHKSRKESPDPRWRAYEHLPLHFFFEDRLSEFQSHYCDRKQPDAFKHRVEPLPKRDRAGRIHAVPKLEQREQDQGQGANVKEKDNAEISDGE